MACSIHAVDTDAALCRQQEAGQPSGDDTEMGTGPEDNVADDWSGRDGSEGVCAGTRLVLRERVEVDVASVQVKTNTSGILDEDCP